MSCIALVAHFYQFMNQIKEIGGFRILGGDLERVFTGGFAGGLRSGDMDVTIWGGLNEVVDLGLPVYHCHPIVLSCLVLSGLSPQYSAFQLCPSLWGLALCLALFQQQCSLYGLEPHHLHIYLT